MYIYIYIISTWSFFWGIKGFYALGQGLWNRTMVYHVWLRLFSLFHAAARISNTFKTWFWYELLNIQFGCIIGCIRILNIQFATINIFYMIPIHQSPNSGSISIIISWWLRIWAAQAPTVDSPFHWMVISTESTDFFPQNLPQKTALGEDDPKPSSRGCNYWEEWDFPSVPMGSIRRLGKSSKRNTPRPRPGLFIFSISNDLQRGFRCSAPQSHWKVSSVTSQSSDGESRYQPEKILGLFKGKSWLPLTT